MRCRLEVNLRGAACPTARGQKLGEFIHYVFDSCVYSPMLG